MRLCSDFERQIRSGVNSWSVAEKTAVLAHSQYCVSCRRLLESSDANSTAPSSEAPEPLTALDSMASLGRTDGSEFATYHASENRSPTDHCRDEWNALLPDPNQATRSATDEPTDGVWPVVPGYDILSRLGRGGMGVVYKARQRQLNRLVALKMIRDSATAGPEQLARLRIEAEAVARLRHPNIVQIYEIGEVGGVPFLSLELLEGGSLDARLKGVPQPRLESARIVATVALAVEAAHQSRVIHRDLKPGNIVLGTDGTPKITDFGLAKRLEEEAEASQTKTGEVMGSPSYMAPEQAQGKLSAIGPATDVYALGAILYEMLTGRPPFRGATVWETVKQVIAEEPVPPSKLQSQVPRDLETICLKCLAKEPNRRYPSAQELADDLHRFLADEPIRARPIPFWERGLKWARRRPVTAFGSAAALLATITLSVVAFTSATQARQRAIITHFQLSADRNEQQHLGQLQTQLTQNPGEAEAIQSKLEVLQAKLEMSTLRTHSPKEYHGFFQKIEQLRQQADQQIVNRARRLRFDQLRDQVLTLSADVAMLGISEKGPGAVIEAASEALGQITKPDGAIDRTVLNGLDQKAQAELIDRCLGLILLWADAAGSPRTGQPANRLAQEGLHVLEKIQRLDVPVPSTQSFYRVRARLHRRNDNPSAAQADLDQLATTEPHGSFDSFGSGVELYHEGQFAEATREFNNSLECDGRHFWARCLLAMSELKRNRPEIARPLLAICHSDRPDLHRVRLLQAFTRTQLLRRQVDAQPGTSATARVSELSPPWQAEFAAIETLFAEVERDLTGSPSRNMLLYALHLNRGLCRSLMGQRDEAGVDYRAAIELFPQYHNAYANWAGDALAAGKLDEALDHLTPAFDQPMERGKADLRSLQGHILALRSKEFAAVASRIELMAQAGGTRLGATQSWSLILPFAPVYRSLEQRDRVAAIDDLRAAIAAGERHPDEVTADLIRLTELLFDGGRHEELLVICRDAIGRSPRTAELYRRQIGALIVLDRREELEKIYHQYAQLGQLPAEIMALLGLTRSQRGDLSGAIKWLNKAIDLKPLRPELHASLLVKRGWLYFDMNAIDLAEQDFEDAILLDPRNGDAYSGRGLIRVKQGQGQLALADATQAALCVPRTAERLLECARIYARASDETSENMPRSSRTAGRIPNSQIVRASELTLEAFNQIPLAERDLCWQKLVQDENFRPVLERLGWLKGYPHFRPMSDAARFGPNRR